MLSNTKTILEKANKGKYAVGAFNVNNMEILQAVVMGAYAKRSPVILQTSEGALKYASPKYLKAMAEVAAETSKIPIALHLDHGRDEKILRDCIRNGWTSVMIDGSHLPFEKNVKITKKIVNDAHKKGVSVEGELGTIGGVEEKIKSRKITYTEPDAAKEFVEKTGVDFLAIAIGTSHGAYKFAGSAKLDINRLRQIKRKLKMPLVLHGASGVPTWLVNQAAKYGAKLGKPQGVPDVQIKQAVKNGINKINTDTDLRLAFDAAVRKIIKEKPKDFDPRHILGPARELMQKVVEQRLTVFGSVRKA